MTELQATACVVGGGPAGAMLSLLLARQGIDVILIEKHTDFLRDFRGDTVHPATLQVLDELGLIEKFNERPHRKMRTAGIVQGNQRVEFADYGRLRHPFPYIAFIPQWDFLNLLTGEAARYPTFRLIMGAEAYDLVREGGRVAGVRYRTTGGGDHTIRAALTVATDGRNSTLRRAARREPRWFGTPMDAVNFRITRRATDHDEGLCMHIGNGKTIGVIDRGEYWHVVYEIVKGRWEDMRRSGAAAVRRDLAETVPFLADRVDEIVSLENVNFLEVQMNRLRRWHEPGLQFLGDAAHAMSPVGGFGIYLAVQDAVAAANLLTAELGRHQRSGTPIDDAILASVRKRRWLPTVVAQSFQRVVQRFGIKKAQDREPVLAGLSPFAFVRFSVVQKFIAYLTGIGIRPEHVHMTSPHRRR